MCDGRDLGVVAEPQDPNTGMPTITVYERTPGGVGYAEQLFESMPEVLQAALDLVTSCPCENGCPGCVGPVLEHEYALDTKELSKALAARGKLRLRLTDQLTASCDVDGACISDRPCYNAHNLTLAYVSTRARASIS